MILKPGDCIKVKTKTLKDVFGECVYKTMAVGLSSPNKDKRAAGVMDGIKFMMLGGSGPSARYGLVIIDSEPVVAQNIKDGITVVLSLEEAVRAEQFYGSKDPKAAGAKAGVIEI